MQTQESFLSSLNNDVMRLLLANILLDRGFGRSIENHMNMIFQAETPELGVNLAALLEFDRILKERNNRYRSKCTILFSVLVIFSFLWLAILFNPGMLGISLLILAVIFFIWGILAYIYYTKLYEERYVLSELFTKEKYSPLEIVKNFDLRNTRYGSNAEKNLVIYGGDSPFIGAGINIGGWSFVIDLGKSKDNAMGISEEMLHFEANDLFEVLHAMCEDLGIDGLSDKNYYFVSGKDIREEEPILPHICSFPRQKIPVSILDTYSRQEDAKIRKYKWIQQHIWKDNVLLSFFFYCDVKGNNLFVETNKFILLPIDEQYRQMDRLPPWNSTTKRELIAGSCLLAPFFALPLAFEHFADILDFEFLARAIMPGKGQHKFREIENNPKYNYGSFSSFREKISAKRFDNPFQALDAQMFTKILERCILNSIVDFLDQHNIDTSDIKERQTTILNSGIMVQGGNITADSIATGTGAQAIVSNLSPTQNRSKAS